MSAPVSALDWTQAGLVLLRDEGMNALTVERLCVALRKTKGSFYHHFRELDAYLAALLARWEEDLTDGPMRDAGREPDPLRRQARLEVVVRGLDHRLDGAVRAWALWDPRAKVAMERVDERRIAYLAELWRQGGRRQPRLLAELEYVAFVGAQQVGLFATPARAARMSLTMHRALELLGSTATRSARPRRKVAPGAVRLPRG